MLRFAAPQLARAAGATPAFSGLLRAPATTSAASFVARAQTLAVRGNVRAMRLSTQTKPRAQPRAKVETGHFQRSSVERKPKIFVAIFAFGMASGILSLVAFFEMTRARCEDAPDPTDSLMTVVEPVTQTKFPLTLQDYSTVGSTHWLVARSVRCMLGLCSLERARAYSYAVYFSSEAAEACKKLKSMEEINEVLLPKRVCAEEAALASDETEDQPDFLPASKFEGAKKGYVFKLDKENGGLGYHKDSVSRMMAHVQESRDSSYPSLALRIVMLRDQNGDHIAHGFDRTLLGRIRSAQGDKKGRGKDALRKLTQFLGRQKEWRKGDTLEFIRLPHGYTDVRVNGEKKLSLNSESLSWAVFDAYMGPKGHMSSASREELISRTEEISSLL